MCAGTLPFRGETAGLIFKAILDHEPAPIIRLNRDVPQELQRIISKALEKDRDLRYHSAADVRTDLKRLNRDSSGQVPADSRSTAVARLWAVRELERGRIAQTKRSRRRPAITGPAVSYDGRHLGFPSVKKDGTVAVAILSAENGVVEKELPIPRAT